MKTLQKITAIAHFLILSVLIYWNYYTNTGAINNQTVGDVSEKFDNLFTPASYAFAIWGIIYLGLIALAIYWIYAAFRKEVDSNSITFVAPTLILAHIGNGIWLWFWLMEDSGYALVIMFFILMMLLFTSLRVNATLDKTSRTQNILIRLPVNLYFGWISVATIANVAAHLSSLGWNGGIAPSMWAVIATALASIVAIFMVVYQKGWIFATVIIWALVAIAVRHASEVKMIMWTAIVGIICITLAVIMKKISPIKPSTTHP